MKLSPVEEKYSRNVSESNSV